jgi:lactoylglutathione lyase
LHNNINVFDLDRSLKFYKDALGLSEMFKMEAPDGSFKIAFLGDGKTPHQLELTWLKDKAEPYNLGDNEIHLAVQADNFEQDKKKHQEMGIICYENPMMGIYFIEDPDGYWTEIIPKRQ